MYRLSRRFRKRFGRNRADGARRMDALEYKIVLLDGTDISFDLHRKATGQELLDMVFKNLDLVEKDYFGLQFMDNHQVSHWLDPIKKIKKQVKIGPPFTLHFRVKFYAAEPHNLGEELTRYHFFLQVKQDIHRGKLEVPLKIAVDLTAYSLQSHLGDFDQEVHKEDYMTEFKFVPQQNHELEKEIMKKHRALLGLNPAECEVNFLRVSRSMDNYGIDMHPVIGDNKLEYTLGLTPRGILLIKDKQKMALFSWPKISKISFKKNMFLMAVHEDPHHADAYTYICSSSKASKHLWKCAIEHHAFFRLVKPATNPRRTSSFLRFGSRFRYSGRTEYQTQKDARLSARKSMKFRRAASERFSKRSTIGYIRVGSRVWGKALNGDYYKGVVTGLGEMVHIKFDNGDTIAHDRTDPECVVFDMDPDPADVEIGTRVIAHWPSLPAKLPGKVIGMEHNKFYVEYDDGDKHHNTANQMRILKPPLYFGPGSTKRGVKKSESMKVTSLTGKAVITTELPRKSISQGASNGSLRKTEQLETREDAKIDAAAKLDDMQSHAEASSDNSRKHSDSTKTSRSRTDFAAVPEKKISSASTDNSDLKSKLHQRSASLPCNVRHPVKDKAPSSGPPSPSVAGKKATRNKSFAAGSSKPGARAPVDIFSLPETDIDSGITVACDTKSGKASRRNMHSLDLLKDSEPNKSEKSPSRVGRSKSDGEKITAQKRVARQRDIHPAGAAPYAPNFLETSLDDKKDSTKGMFDAQRMFHVFVPDSRWDGDRQDVAAGERPVSRRRRNSLPEVRSIHFEDEDELSSLGASGQTPSKKDKTSSLNDLAKTSPTSNTKQAPLHIDNLFSTAEGQGGSGSCSESPNFSPTPEQNTSNNRHVQVTDL